MVIWSNCTSRLISLQVSGFLLLAASFLLSFTYALLLHNILGCVYICQDCSQSRKSHSQRMSRKKFSSVVRRSQNCSTHSQTQTRRTSSRDISSSSTCPQRLTAVASQSRCTAPGGRRNGRRDSRVDDVLVTAAEHQDKKPAVRPAQTSQYPHDSAGVAASPPGSDVTCQPESTVCDSCTSSHEALSHYISIDHIFACSSCSLESFRPQKKLIQFLRATAKCFARLCHRLGVCLSVCLPVCHTRELYQNGAS